MASTKSGYSNRSALAHKLQTVTVEDINPAYYTRVVSAGQEVVSCFKIESYRMVSAIRTPIPVKLINSYQEYMAGCTLHGERCLGSFCVTPRGTMLLPQKMASSMGVMSNDYAKMAEAVFNRDTPSQEITYREKLKTLMLGKKGAMRGNMPAGTVDGSAREVINNCWKLETMSWNDDNDTLYFAIPRIVAQNMRVLRVGVDQDTGLPISTYVEDCVHEGDYMILVRAPSLWHGNVQPVKIVLWDHQCFGLSPSLCDDYHADFDGDEMQLYYVGTEQSIEECKKWKRITPNKFREAVTNLKLPKNIYEGDSDIIERFMQHSTVSIKELMDGVTMPPIAKVARMKEDMANMIVSRMRNPNHVARSFLRESKRGIKDVMNQQLFQGIVGDMLRQASIAASCVIYKGDGVYHIMTANSRLEVLDPSIRYSNISEAYPLGGNSCMRAVRTICAKAQQAALDSHRVSTVEKPKLDLIKNMIAGDDLTMVALSGGTIRDSVMTYKSTEDNVTYCIADVNSIRPLVRRVVAAYNPKVLRAVELVGGDTLSVCKRGINIVCNYYGIRIDELELSSVAVLLCYGLDSSGLPTTTKKGMLDRSMRWLAVVFANHYGKNKTLYSGGYTKKYVKPETATEASAFCNFDYLR